MEEREELLSLQQRTAGYIAQEECEDVINEESSDECTEEEEIIPLSCPNRGCKFTIDSVSESKKMDAHRENCVHQLEVCPGCGLKVKKKDFVVHNIVKRCSEKVQKRRRVQSARQLSANLRQHRIQIKLERHASEQDERQLIRDHQEQQKMEWPQRRRIQSAQPRLMSTAVEARMSSAVTRSEVSRYSRNLMSAVDSCRTCTTKFTPAKSVTFRRDSFSKCNHCDNWRRVSGRVAQSWTTNLF